MHTKKIARTAVTAAAVAAAAISIGLAGAPDTPAAPATAASLTAFRAIPPQTVQATVQPNPSQQIVIPVPPNTDTTTIPMITSDNPLLIVRGATYPGYKTDLVATVMNGDPRSATSGAITVAGWGTYPVTVQPNPSQLVPVAIPPNYATSKLPDVVSEDPNLILISLSTATSPTAPRSSWSTSPTRSRMRPRRARSSSTGDVAAGSCRRLRPPTTDHESDDSRGRHHTIVHSTAIARPVFAAPRQGREQ